MAKPDTWMPFYIADYLRKTMHLTRDQHGAYLLLIMACWDRGGRLPNDPAQLAAITHATPAEWRKLAPVMLPYFEVDGDFLVQGRVVEEREKAQRLSDARRDSGRKGGRPRKVEPEQTESKPKAIGFAKTNQTALQNETPARVALPSPSPVGEYEDADASSVGSAAPTTTAKALWEKDGDFLSAWSICTEQMRTRSSRKASHAAWRRNKAEGSRKLAGLKAYLAQDPDVQRTGGPGFHLWLRDKLPEWLDRLTSPSVVEATWSGPPDVSAVMAHAFGREKGLAYLAAYCAWQDVPAKALLCRNSLICDFIRREAGPRLERIGVRVLLQDQAA